MNALRQAGAGAPDLFARGGFPPVSGASGGDRPSPEALLATNPPPRDGRVAEGRRDLPRSAAPSGEGAFERRALPIWFVVPFDHPDEDYDFGPEPVLSDAEGPVLSEPAPAMAGVEAPAHPPEPDMPPPPEGPEAPGEPVEVDGDPFDPPVPDVNDAGAHPFEARRAEIDARHGALASTALDRPPYAIAREAQSRLVAALDRLRGTPDREALELALLTLDGAGAHLAACRAAVAAALSILPGSPSRA